MLTLVIIAIGVILLLSFVVKSPSEFHIERSLVIDAAPEQIFPLVSDLRAWGAWSPYEKLDPNMKKTYSGSENGAGAVYEWEGSGRAGAGRIEITKVSAPMRVTLALDMLRPIKGKNIVVFSFAEADDGTVVTWAMDGMNPFFVKLVGQFINMDKLIGKDFEEGLLNLKGILEAPLEETI